MKTRSAVIVLILLSLLPLLDLLSPGLPLTHDGKDHVARIASFYRNLEEGVLIPRWGANLNWGFGHPVLMFLYPLPSYMASLIHFLGFSFVDSVKIVFGLSFIASGFTAFLFLRKITSVERALLGSILYLYAPYRFVDLYVRGAIGEHVAFVFPPLIAYFLFRVSKEQRAYLLILASLSVTGLILAHNAISLMVLPFLFLYGIYLVIQSREKALLTLRYLAIGLLGFLLSAFFWLPAFFEGKYTLRDIVTQLDFSERLYPFADFIYSPWGYGVTGDFTLQIGFAHIGLSLLCLVIGLYLIFEKRAKDGIVLTGLFLLTLCIVLLMTPIALPVWESVSLLQKFQFPWRLLTLVVIFTSLMGVITFNYLPKKSRLPLIILVLAVVLLQPQFWQRRDTLTMPEHYYTGIYESTTDTGESSPIWSTRFMERRFTQPLELIGGEATIFEKKRVSTHHQYEAAVARRAQFVENTVYFPGWEVLIDGAKTEVIFQNELHRGLLTFYVPEGIHTIDVMFTDTRLRTMANTLSLSGLFLLFITPYLLYNKRMVRFVKKYL